MASILNSVSSPASAGTTASTLNTAVHVASGGTAQAIIAQTEATRMAAGAKPSANTQPSSAHVQNAISNINKTFQQNGTNMQFSIDPSTKQDVVQVTDTSTGKVIWQIPSKVTLAISEAISQEMTRGALLYQKA